MKLLADGKTVGTRSIRIGQQWEWYPKPRRIADTRLNPMEERIEKLEFPIKEKGAFRAEIVVTNVRMSEEAAKYHHLLGRYPLEAKVQNFNVTVR